jgi:undecaprenyl-diphosphatase
VAAAAVVLGGYAYLRSRGSWPGEVSLAGHLREWLPDRLQPFAIFMAFFGDAVLAPLWCLAVIGMAWEQWDRGAAVRLAAAAAVALPAHVLKSIFGPTQIVSLSRVENYPSGTTAFVAAFFGILGYLAWRRGARTIAAVSGFLVVVVGPALVAGGEHFPSDVIAGYALALAWGVAVLAVTDRVEAHR